MHQHLRRKQAVLFDLFIISWRVIQQNVWLWKVSGSWEMQLPQRVIYSFNKQELNYNIQLVWLTLVVSWHDMRVLSKFSFFTGWPLSPSKIFLRPLVHPSVKECLLSLQQTEATEACESSHQHFLFLSCSLTFSLFFAQFSLPSFLPLPIRSQYSHYKCHPLLFCCQWSHVSICSWEGLFHSLLIISKSRSVDNDVK